MKEREKRKALPCSLLCSTFLFPTKCKELTSTPFTEAPAQTVSSCTSTNGSLSAQSQRDGIAHVTDVILAVFDKNSSSRNTCLLDMLQQGSSLYSCHDREAGWSEAHYCLFGCHVSLAEASHRNRNTPVLQHSSALAGWVVPEDGELLRSCMFLFANPNMGQKPFAAFWCCFHGYLHC